MTEPTKEPSLAALFSLWAIIGAALGGVMFLFLGGAPLTHVFVGALAGAAAGLIAYMNREVKR